MFQDLTDGNIMVYLCENQPLGIYQVLCCLWESVINENALELIALAIHGYITFIEHIPLGLSSDTFVWNFVCYSIEHTIKECCHKEEFIIFAKGLTLILDILLPKLASFIIQKPLSQLHSTLIMKREEKYLIECKELLNDLVSNIKNYLNTNDDVVDFISSLSQNVVIQDICISMSTFCEKLGTLKLAMVCPRYLLDINFARLEDFFFKSTTM